LIAALVVIAPVVAGVALIAGDGRTTGYQDTPGPLVPDVRVARLHNGGEFRSRRPADAETPTVLWLWALWCEVCTTRRPASSASPPGRAPN
jgi:hypothetical protein